MAINSFPIETTTVDISSIADNVALAESAATTAVDAKDATALIAQTKGAYTDTTIAAAIAAGVAALSVDDTFTATGYDVDYIGLYVIETGPVAKEIAKLPKSEAIDDKADQSNLDTVSQSLAGLARLFAEYPRLQSFDIVAAFSKGGYGQKSSGFFDSSSYAGMFEMRLPEPTDALGLASPDSTSRKNLCRYGLNTPDDEGILATNDVDFEVVDVSDLPDEPRQYFEGIDLVWPVTKVVHLTNSTGSTKNVQASIDPVATLSGDRTASAYIWSVSGSCRASTGSTFASVVPVGTGERSEVTDSAGSSATIRLNDGGECYFTGLQLENGSSASEYEDAFDVRIRVLPNTQPDLSVGGVFFAEVFFPSEPEDGSTSLLSISDVSGSTGPTKVVKCIINWSGGGGVVLSCDDGTNSVSVSRNLTYSNDVSSVISGYWDADGNIGICVDGGPVVTAESGADLSGMVRLRIGSSDNLGPSNVDSGLEGNILTFAYREGTL